MQTISASEAYSIASGWGSYISSGDPGAVFYTFPPGDARPVSEEHRSDLLEYARHCEKIAHGRHWTLQDDETEEDAERIAQDVEDLRDLILFFETSPLATKEAA